MRVVVPFAIGGHSQGWALKAAALALRQDGVDAHFEHMLDDFSYFALVARMWGEGQTFAVVEHDIVVWPGAIQELENCIHPWCTLPYYCSVGWIEDGLGCTKFDHELMVLYPDFFGEPFPACCKHDRNYCGLDRFIAHRMQDLGLKPHIHRPGVVNLNQRWT